MSDQEVFGGGRATAGDTVDRAVTAEWRRIQRERIDEERSEAGADPAAAPLRQRLPWAGLLAALAAGVVAAILANMAVGSRGRPGGAETPGVGAPLGLLARPGTSVEALPPDGESAGADEPPAAGVGTADVEVFVPVPKTAVGPPPRADEAAP